MRRLFIFLLPALVMIGYQTSEARSLRAYLNYSIFKLPGDGPYIETYLTVSGKSIIYKPNDSGLFQASIEVKMMFRQGDKIVEFDKYELKSPEISDTSLIDFDFIDQQRYFLPEGDYDLEISITDLNGRKKSFDALQPFSISFPEDKVAISGIELLESFSNSTAQSILTKGAYDLVPLITNFYPENRDKLSYYAEIYHTETVAGKDEMVLLTSNISSFETGKAIHQYARIKRMPTGTVLPVLGEYDISDLPSGNYKLVMEVRDRQNQLLTVSELFFQRSNPGIPFQVDDLATIDVKSTFAANISNPDTLGEYIKCLSPIATQIEKAFIYNQLKESDLQTRQQFFYRFWVTRNDQDPGQAWIDYSRQVKAVQLAYGTPVQKGYDSDRGRVYLQYGPPNTINESHMEPNSYPYEIWWYYELGGNQRNKKFVFYAYDAITNNYSLLHSDAIGEVANYRWQIFLNNRSGDPYDLDINRPGEYYGYEADDYYRNPR